MSSSKFTIKRLGFGVTATGSLYYISPPINYSTIYHLFSKIGLIHLLVFIFIYLTRVKHPLPQVPTLVSASSLTTRAMTFSSTASTTQYNAVQFYKDLISQLISLSIISIVKIIVGWLRKLIKSRKFKIFSGKVSKSCYSDVSAMNNTCLICLEQLLCLEDASTTTMNRTSADLISVKTQPSGSGMITKSDDFETVRTGDTTINGYDNAIVDETLTVTNSDNLKGNWAIVLNCGHSFHSECFEDWFSMSSSCPYCRERV